MEIKDIKKVELHLHLDGSVRVKTITELSSLDYSYVEKQMVIKDEKNASLTDYLKKFDFPLKFMQTENNLKRFASELVEDLIKDNVVYAEIRFAPIKHMDAGMDLDMIVLSVLSGLMNDKVKTKLILCMMRGDSKDNNNKIIELARKYNLPIDLAGDEKRYPNELYKEQFKKIEEYGLKYTIHAGEAKGAKSIMSALDFRTKRLGHGVKIENNEKLIDRIIKNDILLEICPTSNVNTKFVSDIKYHPIYDYYVKGIPISINTDNRTVSNTTLNKEYQLLMENFPFTVEDFININVNALNHSFLEPDEIEELEKLLIPK